MRTVNFHFLKKALLTTLSTLLVNTFHIEGKELTIFRTNTPIYIDGAENENTWKSIPWEPINLIHFNNSDISLDFWAQFKMCYDDENIYLLVKVHDPTPNQVGSTSWQNDCVELFFAMDTSNSSTYRYGDWQLRKTAAITLDEGGVDGEMGTEYGISWSINLMLEDPNFKVEQSDGYSEYVQEWQIPIATLVNGSNFNGTSFRFDIHIADNDGTGNDRTGSIFWNSKADDQWTKVEHQGYIYLSESIAIGNDDNTVCQQYLDLLQNSRDSINFLILQLNQSLTEISKLKDSIYQQQLQIIQTKQELNTIADSLSVLYNMVVNNQSIILLSFNEVTTSVVTKKGNVDLHIYPNPAQDRMYIECSETIYAYSIYTPTGKLVYSTTLPTASQSPYAIQLPSLSSGLYSLQLQTSKGTIAALFLKR